MHNSKHQRSTLPWFGRVSSSEAALVRWHNLEKSLANGDMDDTSVSPNSNINFVTTSIRKQL